MAFLLDIEVVIAMSDEKVEDWKIVSLVVGQVSALALSITTGIALSMAKKRSKTAKREMSLCGEEVKLPTYSITLLQREEAVGEEQHANLVHEEMNGTDDQVNGNQQTAAVSENQMQVNNNEANVTNNEQSTTHTTTEALKTEA